MPSEATRRYPWQTKRELEAPTTMYHCATASLSRGEAAVSALKAAAEQTQNERAAMGQRAQHVATEKFGRDQLVQQFLDVVTYE